MPKITPHIVADFIAANWPAVRKDDTLGTLDQGSHQPLGVLVAMLDRLEDVTLAGLSSETYRELVIATEYLRTTVNRWQYPPPPGRLPHSVAAFQPLNNRHPVVVLFQILSAAPEEAIAVAQERLTFLADTALEASLATDLASAESAIADGRYKNSCVMAGAAIEALLLWAVQKRTSVQHRAALEAVQDRRRREARPALQSINDDPTRWSLEQLIEIARELPVLSGEAAEAAMLAKGFRNLIHPGRTERLQVRPTRGTAFQGLAAVTLVVEDLAERSRTQDRSDA